MDLVDRRTHATVNVPEHEVAGALKSGMFALPKGARLPITTEMGVTGAVPAGQAGLALERRASIPTEAQFRQAEQARQYGDVGSAVAAGAHGALEGIGEAFGAPVDPFIVPAAGALVGEGFTENDPYRGRRYISPEQAARDALQGAKAEHPVASMGGELAGLVAATALSGGEAPLSRLGSAAEGIGGTIARGASEGAALGGVGAVNEAALGDTDLTASKFVAGMGEGALFGGALGAGFKGLGLLKDEARGAAGRYLAKLAPSDIESLAEKTYGYAPDGLGQKVQRFYAKAAAGISGKDADLISKFTELSPEGSEARRIGVFDAPKIQEEAERAVRQNVDALLRSGDLVSAEARGALKADYVARAVKKGNELEAQTFAREQLSRIIEGAEAQLTHVDGVAPQMVKPIETLSRSAYRVMDALEAGDNARLFVELDNMKRATQRLTSTGFRSVPNIADPLEQLQARRTVDWMRGAAEDLRGALEREDLWGRAATDQKTINAAWTRQIDASQRFHRALTTETVREPSNPYVRLRGADPTKVQTYVRNLTNPNNDLTHTAVRDFVDSTKDLADAIHKSYDLPPDKLEEVARVRTSAGGFGKAIGRAEKSLALANQYEALTKHSADSPISMLGTVGSIVGGLPGGIIGGAVGGVARALSNPGRTIAQLAAVERMVTKVDARIGSSLRSFFRGGSAARPALHEAATPEGFERITKLLSEAVDTEGNVTPAGAARISNAIGDLHEGAPKIASASAATMTTILTFLAAKLPAGMRDPHDMFPGDEPPLVSETERETWARYFAAATEPTGVFEHLAHGDVTPEEAEALKVCHRPIYDEAGAKVEQMSAEAAAKGKPLDYAPRCTLGVLFERRTDATLAPAVMSDVAAARQPAPAPQPAPGKKGRGGSGGGGFLKPAGTLAPRFMDTFEASASRKKGGI